MIKKYHPKHSIDKQAVIRIYNQIIQDIYGKGVSKHKIEISENRLMIFAIHKRITALKVMRENFPELVSYTNTAIFTEFKARLKQEIETLTGLTSITILMDYDATTEHACSIIYFDKNL